MDKKVFTKVNECCDCPWYRGVLSDKPCGKDLRLKHNSLYGRHEKCPLPDFTYEDQGHIQFIMTQLEDQKRELEMLRSNQGSDDWLRDHISNLEGDLQRLQASYDNLNDVAHGYRADIEMFKQALKAEQHKGRGNDD